jgi:hypothetical protein
MYDPDLHLFMDSTEITATQNLHRRVTPLRRESLEPVLEANGADEGTAIGYATAMLDAETSEYRLWYMTHQDYRIRLAVSADARTWTRRGSACDEVQMDNLGLVPLGPSVDPWFADARLAGFGYCTGGGASGLHLLRSMDGEHLEVRQPGILSGVGDRSSLLLDQATGTYSLISRPSRRLPGFRQGELLRPRVANLWTSSDLVTWQNHGPVLGYDEQDPADAEIYGMVAFRCGAGFAAFVELYHRGMERLDTHLAWSRDGIHWQRVEPRDAALALGGEGTWDSHWAVPTNNAPIPAGDRLLVPYTGAGTKHGSGKRHCRGIGLASIRQEGWVSLEAGRAEGVLATAPLPLIEPMELEVNADCRTGVLAVEVQSAAFGEEGVPLAGYAAEAGRSESWDAVRHPVHWGERTVVEPIPGGRCVLRFDLQQASLYAYRWRPVQGADRS